MARGNMSCVSSSDMFRTGAGDLGEVKLHGDTEENFHHFVLLRVEAIEDLAEALQVSGSQVAGLRPGKGQYQGHAAPL